MIGKIYFNTEEEGEDLRTLLDIIIPNDVVICVEKYNIRRLDFLPDKPYCCEVEMSSKDWAKMKRKYFKNRKPCNLPRVIKMS